MSVRSLRKRVHGLDRGTYLFVEVHFIPVFNHQIIAFPRNLQLSIQSQKRENSIRILYVKGLREATRQPSRVVSLYITD